MSDYRPWELNPEPKEGAVKSEKDDKPEKDDAEPEAIEEPAAPTKSKASSEKSKASLGKEKFELPPGMAENDRPTKRGPDPAGAMLLWIGGFLFIGALLLIIATGAIITMLEMENDFADADEVRTVRSIGGTIGILLGGLYTLAGFGILHGQQWGRNLGMPLAVLALPTFVFTLPGGIALGFIRRDW